MGLAGTFWSVAVFVTTIGVVATLLKFVCAGNSGGRFTSLTTTLKLLVALNACGELSVTTVVIRLVLGPWFFAGVQVITPLVELIDAPVGGVSSEYVRLYAGTSLSVAALVTVKVASSLTVWLVCAGSDGPL